MDLYLCFRNIVSRLDERHREQPQKTNENHSVVSIEDGVSRKGVPGEAADILQVQFVSLVTD